MHHGYCLHRKVKRHSEEREKMWSPTRLYHGSTHMQTGSDIFYYIIIVIIIQLNNYVRARHEDRPLESVIRRVHDAELKRVFRK